ncbi:hypothetical protein [Lactococcus taiwanensis]|uniref:hypothetical protein n=1 Tax=Lactococcus taiwanensis TaxID=1151742 RepID=UPI0019629848|nr:hypothetical protein [Lactococcus taiwanensis]QRZ11887.1 hypothetical protein JVB21_04390 [Lactococcus taiwanensis]
MNNEYMKFIIFSSKHERLVEDVNFLLDDRILKQVIYFQSDELYKAEFIDLVLNSVLDNIEIRVDDILISTNNVENTGYDEENVKITLTYPLKDVVELYLLEDKNLNETIYDIVKDLNIEDVIQLNCKIDISLHGSPIHRVLNLNTDWSSFNDDAEYLGKKAIILPNMLPEQLRKDFLNDIFTAIIDLFSERKIADGYLIKLGNTKVVHLSEENFITENDIKNLYLIVEYIFNDKYRYNDKIHILRRILTDTLFDIVIEEVSWSKILQTLKENYSLFIDDKLAEYIRLRNSLISQVIELKQKISKSIDDKVDDASKQLLVIVATVISSFVVKVGGKNQLILIGSAILYVLLILFFNKLKGIHASSNTFKDGREDIKKIESKLSALEYFDDTVLISGTKDIDSSLTKLDKVEYSHYILLVIIEVILIAVFIFA